MNIKRFLCVILSLLAIVGSMTALVSCEDEDSLLGDPIPEAPADLFNGVDKTGFPEKLMTLADYKAATKEVQQAYRVSFATKVDFVRWYQEAYRLSGAKGSFASKTDYMKDFDKTGFPTTVLTIEEYNAADWRVQDDYLKSFADTTAYFEWYHEAQRIYEEEQDREEIGGDGEVDMGS